MVSEKAVCPAAHDDHLREPGIERLNQLGYLRWLGSHSRNTSGNSEVSVAQGEQPSKPKKWRAYNSERDSFEFATRLLPAKNERTIEAELMDWADDVTYSVHDLEDFYRSGRLPLHLLAQRDSPEREEFFENVFERRFDDPEFAAQSDLKEAFTSFRCWRNAGGSLARVRQPQLGSPTPSVRIACIQNLLAVQRSYVIEKAEKGI
jgi:hypothetical protein